MNTCTAWRAPKKEEVIIAELMSESEATYKKVYDHYSDILELYYKLEKVPLTTKDFYTKQLLCTIVRYVQQGLLPLYGNCFSRAWRHVSSCNDTCFPLKKFTSMFLEDAIGHLTKQHKKLAYKGYDSAKIRDLIHSLTHIRHIVIQSLEYKYEELFCAKEQLEGEITALKRQVSHLQSECSTLRAHLEKQKDN